MDDIYREDAMSGSRRFCDYIILLLRNLKLLHNYNKKRNAHKRVPLVVKLIFNDLINSRS